MELDSVLDKVRKLIERAERADTPAAEAVACQEKADALMQQYKIEEDLLDKSRPAADRAKPTHILVALAPDMDIVGWVADLAVHVATHCECDIRRYSVHRDGTYHSKVYGYPSDLRYFEILYTTLRLHMLGALRPGVDLNKTVEENAYALHNAGYNWFDIAKLYGWTGPVTPLPGEPKLMYLNTRTHERLGWAKAIKQYKVAYDAAVAARHEQGIHVPPSSVKTFQRSAAQGYVTRIHQRLLEIRKKNQIGSALVLRRDSVHALFREENADLFRPEINSGKSGRSVKYVPPPFSQAGYQAGVKQANSASLNPQTESGGATRAIE